MAIITRTRPPLKLAVVILICTFIWLALSVFHVFRTSPVHYPGWVGLVVGVGSLVTPIFMFVELLHWIVRLIAGLLFFGLTFVFSWFYDQHPTYYCIIMVLLYIESFCIFPLLLRRRRRQAEQLGGG